MFLSESAKNKQTNRKTKLTKTQWLLMKLNNLKLYHDLKNPFVSVLFLYAFFCHHSPLFILFQPHVHVPACLRAYAFSAMFVYMLFTQVSFWPILSIYYLFSDTTFSSHHVKNSILYHFLFLYLFYISSKHFSL